MAEAQEIVLKFAISPFGEMAKERVDFLQKNKFLAKKIVDWKFNEKVAVNPRKWKEKSLIDAMQAIARYELKIFDARVAQEMEKLKKDNSVKGELELVRKVEKHYKKIGDQIEDKIFNALEEIVEDKGDDLKALKEGKAALDKVDDFDPDGVFTTAADAALKALAAFATVLDKERDEKEKAEEQLEDDKEKLEQEILSAETEIRTLEGQDKPDQKKIEEQKKIIKEKQKQISKLKLDWDDDDLTASLKMTEAKLTKIHDDFKKEVEGVTGAIEYLRSVAGKLKKNKDVNPALTAFAEKVIAADKAIFTKWEKAATGYSNTFGVAQTALGKADIAGKNVSKIEKLISDTSKSEKHGIAFEKELKKLTTEFRKLEKELK